MSCVIKSIARFDDNQVLQLKKIPTQKVIIENLVTDNIYEYELKDSLYFIKVYKIEDYVERPIQGNQPKFTPKKSGWVK